MKPFSLDIFEDQLYWVAKEKGEVWRQNKFGKGNKEKVLVVNPWLTQVRVFHQLRYNQSGNKPSWNEMMSWTPCFGRVAIALVDDDGHDGVCMGALNILNPERKHHRLNEQRKTIRNVSVSPCLALGR